jgi:Ran GTPase-activating protein (RanGAP) involved in mRNA processing and transport
VKQIMAGRRDEASFIGNVVRTDAKSSSKSKDGSERLILIVTLYRVLWARPNGKIVQESPLLDLKTIVSLDNKSLTLIFKDGEVSQSTEEPDIIIDCIRRAHEFCYHGLPEDKKPQLRIEPKTRISVVPRPDEPCDGIVSCYKALCDYYGVIPHRSVCWDLDNLYANNKSLDMKKFTAKYLDPLSDKESLPLLHAFAFNHYFTTLTIKHLKFSPLTFQGIIEAVSLNSTLQELTLSDVTLTEKAEKCWTMFFDGLFGNPSCSLRRVFLANSPIEDKAFVPFGLWLKKYQGPLSHLDLSNTAGEKAGKSTGFLAVFEAFANNKPLADSLEVLKLNGNKLERLEPPLARVVQVAPKLRMLELSGTGLDLNVLTSLGLMNDTDKSLRSLTLSNNKLAKPEQWTAFLKYVEAPVCCLTELNISSTAIPVTVVKELISKFNGNITLKLNLADNNLGKAGAQAVASIAPQMSAVVGLDLSDNALGDEGLTVLFEGLYNCPSLTYLNVGRNWSKPGPTAKRQSMLHALAQLINHTNCPIESLHLAGNKENRLREDVVPLLSAVGKNKRLTELDISGHGFGDKGANQLARLLVVNVMLQTIYWDDNNTGHMGLANVRDGLESNTSIRVMPLPWRDISAVMSTITNEEDKKMLSMLLNKIESHIMENQTQ